MQDTTVRDLVAEYLAALSDCGETRLPVDESARALLGTWIRAARAGKICPQTHPEAPQSMLQEKTVVREVVADYDAEAPLPPDADSINAPLAVEPEVKEQPKQDFTLRVPEGNVEEKLAYLQSMAARWEPARSLGSLRGTMVFAVGNPHASLMLIGEAPGYQEERQQEPFVGPAGEKLTQILRAMGLQRSDVYISNIVKFRPSLPNQTTNNRQPTEEEIASCLPLITEEIRAIRPKVIVALGGTAAQGLLGYKASVGSLRGKSHEMEGIPLIITYHPSYLLRSESNRDKRLVWEDMMRAMELLGMPISDKQKGYFLASS